MKTFKKLMAIAISAAMIISLVACDKSAEEIVSVADDYASALVDLDAETIEEMSTEVDEDALAGLGFISEMSDAVVDAAIDTISYEVDAESSEASAKDEEGSVDVTFTYVDLEALSEDEEAIESEEAFVDAIADAETKSITVTFDFELDGEDWLIANSDDIISEVFDDIMSFEIIFIAPLAEMIDYATWFDTTSGYFVDVYEFTNPYSIEADLVLNEAGVAAMDSIYVDYIVYQNGTAIYESSSYPVQYTDGTFVEMPLEAFDDPNSDGLYVSAGTYYVEVYVDDELIITTPTCTVTNVVDTPVTDAPSVDPVTPSIEPTTDGISPYAAMIEEVMWYYNDSTTLELDMIPYSEYQSYDCVFTYTYMVFDSSNLEEPIYVHDEFYSDSGYFLENYFYPEDIGLSEFDPNVVYMMVVIDEAGNVVAVGTSDYAEGESIPQ